jgi:hypothetical protein
MAKIASRLDGDTAHQKGLLKWSGVINKMEMFSIGRLSIAIPACLLLSSCGLINTALRLAPYLLLAEEDGKSSPHQRGRLIENRGDFHPPATLHQAPGQQMAAR